MVNGKWLMVNGKYKISYSVTQLFKNKGLKNIKTTLVGIDNERCNISGIKDDAFSNF